MIENIFDIINNMKKNNEVEMIDLNTDEGYDKFTDKINELKKFDFSFGNSSPLFDAFSKSLGDGFNSFLDKMQDVADNLKKEREKKALEDKKKKNVFVRPSEKISTDEGLKIHALVQEYVDTMVKPFNNNMLSNKQINDAYAGLYEFAAWLLKK